MFGTTQLPNVKEIVGEARRLVDCAGERGWRRRHVPHERHLPARQNVPANFGITVNDVQQMINEALGLATASDDLNAITWCEGGRSVLGRRGRPPMLCSIPRTRSDRETLAPERTLMTPQPTTIATVAEAFFNACETGQGWEVCGSYCAPEATFSAQAEPLADVKTLAQYTEWMKGILTVLPDAHYHVKSFAIDAARNNVAAYGIFYGTHTGEGGPVPPTGRRIATDYVYVMQFEGDKIAHMTKIWNAGLALKDLGWA